MGSGEGTLQNLTKSQKQCQIVRDLRIFWHYVHFLVYLFLSAATVWSL